MTTESETEPTPRELLESVSQMSDSAFEIFSDELDRELQCGDFDSSQWKVVRKFVAFEIRRRERRRVVKRISEIVRGKVEFP